MPRTKRAAAAPDLTAAHELLLYAENERALYAQRQAIERALLKRVRAGTYSSSLAPKAWMYWIDAAAKRYAKEFGTPGDGVSVIFTKATRLATASEWAMHEGRRLRGGEYDYLLDGRK